MLDRVQAREVLPGEPIETAAVGKGAEENRIEGRVKV